MPLSMICTLFTGQTSKEGILMRYSHEFKLMCIEMYRQGIWPVTPDGIKEENFHKTIRTWSRIEMYNGADALKHAGSCKSISWMFNEICCMRSWNQHR